MTESQPLVQHLDALIQKTIEETKLDIKQVEQKRLDYEVARILSSNSLKVRTANLRQAMQANEHERAEMLASWHRASAALEEISAQVRLPFFSSSSPSSFLYILRLSHSLDTTYLRVLPMSALLRRPA